ncbi:alanine racemase [Nocardioides terrisoli]|uniref:alanine racemase n=1 Tax=Nocardioides terrisoli TaxID=3388267 RepID=UPI00287B79C3|nr:alanine racemase [Nocardioides marmorisolisilvae]
MSLVLHVDGDRWRDHLRRFAAAHPGLVPVTKGNGYGFGNHRLARRAGWLGADTLAVGTYDELPDVAQRYDGDLLVLTPWRPFLPAAVTAVADDRVLHTVGRLDDLAALAAAPERPRVVLERATSMRRHGFGARELREAADLARRGGVRLEGVSMHLPLPGRSHLAEMETLLTDIVAAGTGGTGTVWVSHLGDDELAGLARRHPDLRFRPRVGTDLWLGDRGALRVAATVLDAHPVARGDVYGYRGRTAPRSGTILVVSGGTAHGIGLEAPTAGSGLRDRAAAVARGGLDALGLVRSPFTIDGKPRLFAEPPHMQCSMLFLPAGAEVPAVGSEVGVRVRHTATTFDSVDYR